MTSIVPRMKSEDVIGAKGRPSRGPNTWRACVTGGKSIFMATRCRRDHSSGIPQCRPFGRAAL